MRIGLNITILGALITLVGNYVFIPHWGMYASAWTTLVCYTTMVLITYFIGQKYFPIPYPVKRILTYLLVMLIIFFIKMGINSLSDSWTNTMQFVLRIPAATILMSLYILFILKVERTELKAIPSIGKFFL